MRTAQNELDLLQRECNVLLLQDDPNPAKALRQSITRKQINEHHKKIVEKKTEVRRLQQEESDLEDDLRHSGGDAGWSWEQAMGLRSGRKGRVGFWLGAAATAPGALMPLFSARSR